MNRHAMSEFVSLLESVERGAREAYAAAAACRPKLEDGYCLFNLQEQFKLAFGYRPGRTEALAPILRLARKAVTFERDETMWLFTSPEWERLVQMSGPIEAVLYSSCTQCSARRMALIASGFTDEFSAVCDSCGNALFQSIYDDRELPPCGCGGIYRRSDDHCPACGAKDAVVEQQSPYEYFSTHSWTRRGT